MITTNSLGQRIANTDEQIAAFWRWFRDSCVVDKEGRPLVVYHGSHLGEKKQFDPIAYFTTDEEDAREYADEKGFVHACYLYVFRPKELPTAWDSRRQRMTPKNVARLKSLEYDGVVSEGTYPGTEHWIVFSPTQIKAVNNRGTFDPADPVITNPRRNPPIPYEPLAAADGMQALRGYKATIQATDWTCGPAAARGVLYFLHKVNIPEEELAARCGTTERDGTDPKALARALGGSVVEGLTIEDLVERLRLGLPTMLLWNDWGGHWVVVIGYNPVAKTLLLADPANKKTGLRVHRYDTVNKHWSTRVGNRGWSRTGIVVG